MKNSSETGAKPETWGYADVLSESLGRPIWWRVGYRFIDSIIPLLSLSCQLIHALLSGSGSFDEPENEDQNDCPDSGNNNASKQAPASGDTKRTKKKSSEQSPQYSYDDVSNYAEATALHKHSCQPPRN